MFIHCDVNCSSLEWRANLELNRLLRSATGLAWRSVRGPLPAGKGIVLGRPEAGSAVERLVAEAGLADDLAWAGEQGYIIASVTAGDHSVVLVAAEEPRGVLYGAMRLASLAGWRFYLSREMPPVDTDGELAAALRSEERRWPGLRLAQRPRFAVRGALPWFNFLCGPTSWDEEDWASYIDGLARSGANTLGFHVYTGGLERYYTYVEPFVRVAAEGVLPEAELDTTATARWGYRPMATREFAAGSALCYSHEVFGSEAAVPKGDLRSRYERAQRLLGYAMRRANAWGIDTFLGIEAGIVPPEVHSLIPPAARLVSGELDPTHSAALRVFHDTLWHIVETYPDLDALWLFQHEHVLFSHVSSNLSPGMQKLCERYGDAFPELDETARWKGPWLLGWVQAAWEWTRKHAPHLRLAVSGWGGASQFTRLLPGLHRTMPEPVVLSLLLPGQGAGPLPQELAALSGRTVWAVPWWEGDLHMWHPQPRVATLTAQQDVLAAYGFAGCIGLHWRTRDIEQNAWAFFEGAWESRSGERSRALDRYTDYVARGWGVPASEAAQAARLVLQSEEEKWFAEIVSPEYFPYDSSWGQIPPEKRERIEELLAFLEACAVDGAGAAADLAHARAVLRFVLLLDRWSRQVAEAERLVGEGKLREAWDTLQLTPANETIRTYTARVTTQGELGVLASLNQRAWQAYRDLITAVAESLGGELGGVGPLAESSASGSPPNPTVVFPARKVWDLATDDRVTWRVLTGELGAVAAFVTLVHADETAQRLALDKVGPCRFCGTFDPRRLVRGDETHLQARVEILLPSGRILVPAVGGETAVTVVHCLR